jgi:UDP-N-acetylmuramyl pentapeptide phosphotransferase/UDP-N-acetylglucosamine-1-phosphate transferase
MNLPVELGVVAGADVTWVTSSLSRYVLAFGVALLGALLLTPLVRWLAIRMGMVDHPGDRRIHVAPTPRGGGLALFAAFHLTVFLMLRWDEGGFGPAFPPGWWPFFLGVSSLLAAIGLLDDFFSLKPWLKLAGQVVVAALLWGSGINFSAFFAVNFPPWVNFLLTMLWIVGMINAFNLIDGLDGLAAGLALIAALGLAITLFFRNMSGAAIPFLILAGTCLGFLRYNFHPASVFLGDTGSMFIGLTLATLPLLTASKQELVASMGVPLLILGIPLYDTVIAIWRRSVRAALPELTLPGASRFRVMQGDKEHLHHRVLAKTLNQRHAAILLYIVNVVLVLIGLAAMLLGRRAPGIYLLAFVVAVFVMVQHLTRVELWDTGRAFLSRTRETLSQRLVVPVFMGLDLVLLSLAWGCAHLLAGMSLEKQELKILLPCAVAPVFILLALARVYHRVWSRALLREYALVAVVVTAGVLLSAGVLILSDLQEEGWRRTMLLYLILSVIFTVAVRLIGETIRDSIAALERLTLLDRPEVVRVVVCGGGERLRLFLRERRGQTGSNTRVVVGILDDDVNLRGRLVMGYPVLGSCEELPAVVQEQQIHEVIITARMSAERKGQLMALAQEAGVPLQEWTVAEVKLT